MVVRRPKGIVRIARKDPLYQAGVALQTQALPIARNKPNRVSYLDVKGSPGFHPSVSPRRS